MREKIEAAKKTLQNMAHKAPQSQAGSVNMALTALDRCLANGSEPSGEISEYVIRYMAINNDECASPDLALAQQIIIRLLRGR